MSDDMISVLPGEKTHKGDQFRTALAEISSLRASVCLSLAFSHFRLHWGCPLREQQDPLLGPGVLLRANSGPRCRPPSGVTGYAHLSQGMCGPPGGPDSSLNTCPPNDARVHAIFSTGRWQKLLIFWLWKALLDWMAHSQVLGTHR